MKMNNPQSPIESLVDSLIREHLIIRGELHEWKNQIRNQPDLLNLNTFIDYYYSRIAVHAEFEERELPLKAKESDTALDLEAFRFSHDNLDVHIEGLTETFRSKNIASPEMIIKEVTEMCDLIENHFQEEEHHLFPRDMQEIYETSGGE